MPATSTQSVLESFRAQPSLPDCSEAEGAQDPAQDEQWFLGCSPKENPPSYLVLSSPGTKLRSSEVSWPPSGNTEECSEGENNTSKAQSPSPVSTGAARECSLPSGQNFTPLASQLGSIALEVKV